MKWVFLYAPVAAVFFLWCAYHVVRHERVSLRRWILGGLIVFALGGLACELVSYIFYPLPDVLQRIEFALEEGLEMVGVIFILVGCLLELDSTWQPVAA